MLRGEEMHLQQHPLDTADQAVPLKTGSCEFGGSSGLGDRWEAEEYGVFFSSG